MNLLTITIVIAYCILFVYSRYKIKKKQNQQDL